MDHRPTVNLKNLHCVFMTVRLGASVRAIASLAIKKVHYRGKSVVFIDSNLPSSPLVSSENEPILLPICNLSDISACSEHDCSRRPKRGKLSSRTNFKRGEIQVPDWIFRESWGSKKKSRREFAAGMEQICRESRTKSNRLSI